MTAVTTLNIIDLPKITPMSLHSIVQAAQESPITRLTGKMKKQAGKGFRPSKLGWPMLLRIAKHSLHNEGICK
jgi:hypothetical protein